MCAGSLAVATSIFASLSAEYVCFADCIIQLLQGSTSTPRDCGLFTFTSSFFESYSSLRLLCWLLQSQVLSFLGLAILLFLSILWIVSIQLVRVYLTPDLILLLLPLVYRSFNPTVLFLYLLRTRFLDTIVRRDRILQFWCNILGFRSIFTKRNPQSIVIVGLLSLILCSSNPTFHFLYSFSIVVFGTILCISQFIPTNIVFRSFELY